MTPERFRVVVVVLLLATLCCAAYALKYACQAQASMKRIEQLEGYGLAADSFTERMDSVDAKLAVLEESITDIEKRSETTNDNIDKISNDVYEIKQYGHP